MKRALTVFFVATLAGIVLWPVLREIGLAWLPGNVAADVYGYRLHVPLGLSFLITAAIWGAWRMLEPR